MLKQTALIVSLLCLSPLAWAGSVGKVVYMEGDVRVDGRPAQQGATVSEGALVVTGIGGRVFVRTVDNGMLTLQPNTQARVAAYHIDEANPANTRVKLELLAGVAQSRSGQGVKKARQNFRFNTPVAAIGIRGTDFTVYADQQQTRVAVLSGRITMSGFGDNCSPEGSGPCEGVQARELSASQRGQVLQLQRNQPAPVLINSGNVVPDVAAAPRAEEPNSKGNAGLGATSLVPVQPNLDAKKSEALVKTPVPPVNGPVMPVPPPPVDGPKQPDPVVIPSEPEQSIRWGRFVAYQNLPATMALADAGNNHLMTEGRYALYRTAGKEFIAPQEGAVSFNLKSGEAYIVDNDTRKAPVAANVQNGVLAIDFGKTTFNTSFDLVSGTETFKMAATGNVTPDGFMYGDGQFKPGNTMGVSGALSNEGGGSAVYLFRGRLDESRVANGVTVWGK